MSKKMKLLEVSESELLAMKQFYQQEYQNTLRKLEHLENVLTKMGEDVLQRVSTALTDEKEPPKSSAPSSAAPKRTRRKKRGPKPVWGNFILSRIKAADRPVGYPELIRDAMVLENIPEEKRANTKASILNSAFRLRKINNKIDTVGIPGKKEKFLVLSKWMDAGELISPYKEKFEAIINLKKAEEEEKERQKPAPRPVGRPRKTPKAAEEKTPAAKSTTKRKVSTSTTAKKKAATVKKSTKKPASAKTTTRKVAAKKTTATKASAKKTTAAKTRTRKSASSKTAAKK